MKVKCLIVDDEPLAIQLIQNHLSQLDAFEVVATCPNAVEALNVLRSMPVDLLFLDIKMPRITGLDFLKTLQQPPAVIITTAYREYAIEGYDLDLIDYLLKPITFERFLKATERYLQRMTAITQVETGAQGDFINIRADRKFHRLDLNEIIWVESVKDYIVIHLHDRQITAKYKIGDFESLLPATSFLRIHRSFIVNINKIQAFTFSEIEIGGKQIPIGTNYRDDVMVKLQIATQNPSSSKKSAKPPR
ncbi:LytTR family DNA-binding domain-containing protein [Terrimonas sp. NA20]|uniref:LytTR family DNA-binding domain-containing protein n=1 Tax=Terrimonas ginsenosidimutans TaxID=2908004 RepID=A0ABS9L0R0_9BACT|nr:LytTR family DNA-binding domain-containing protein [Terrimonas ginsenosidimutans]MCG2618177.1 LytTR family DNA-binding domain-containing protein [Terrimonas ginsenosidimutans]